MRAIDSALFDDVQHKPARLAHRGMAIELRQPETSTPARIQVWTQGRLLGQLIEATPSGATVALPEPIDFGVPTVVDYVEEAVDLLLGGARPLSE